MLAEDTISIPEGAADIALLRLFVRLLWIYRKRKRFDFKLHSLLVFIQHLKLLNGVGGIERMLTANGVPGWVAYGAYIGEVVAPLLVIANRFVGPAALVMAVNMLFAISLAHANDVLTLGKSGGWGIELQALFLFGSVAIALLAPPSRWRG